MQRKEKGQMVGGDDQIATSAKFLDIMQESYGFNANLIIDSIYDLKEAIN